MYEKYQILFKILDKLFIGNNYKLKNDAALLKQPLEEKYQEKRRKNNI